MQKLIYQRRAPLSTIHANIFTVRLKLAQAHGPMTQIYQFYIININLKDGEMMGIFIFFRLFPQHRTRIPLLIIFYNIVFVVEYGAYNY